MFFSSDSAMHARHLLIINVIEIIGFHPQPEDWGLPAEGVKTNFSRNLNF
jgi:hypothetical protein